MREQPQDALRGAGLRVTPQRVAVLSALHNAGGDHLSADDIWQHLSRSRSLLDRSTAYRVLADLTDVGLLTQVRFDDGVARFEVQSRAHHHAVCSHCAATFDLPDGLLAPLSASLADTFGFEVSPEERLLVRGTCRKCAGRAADGSGGPDRAPGRGDHLGASPPP